jgi:predicted GNAT family acetyltransferase
MIEGYLRDKYEEYLLGLDVHENNSSIKVPRIIINPEFRNQGIGTKIMNDLVNYADNTTKVITLTPSSDFGGNKNKLVQFYKKFGFKLNQGVHKSYEHSDTMIRYPKMKEEFIQEIRSIVRSVLSEAFNFDNNKTFTPPPNVAQKSQAAINVVSRNNLTQSGTDIGSGLNKAKELASKQTQSFDMMRKMKSFFDTHEEQHRKEKAAGKTIENSGIIQSWELRGGDSGRDWVNQEMGSLNQDNLNTKKNLRKAGGAGTNKGMGIFNTKIMSTTNSRIHR